jgi:hypothetical protein
MMRIARAGVTVLALCGAGTAAGHHSVAAEFDTTRQAELQGEITEVWFSNPHVRYRLTIENDDGAAEHWELQAGNVTTLRRQNWTAESLRVGDRVTATGDIGRDGAKKLRIREVVTTDGRVVPPRRAGERVDLNAIAASADKDYGYARLGASHPVDITGPWRNDYRWRLTVDDLEPKPTPFSEEGRRVFESIEPWHDYALRCMALGLPRVFGAPYSMEIVDAGSHYVFLYTEHNTPRRVFMDGRRAPDNTPATSMGFSVGHWEGEALVIETTHLAPGWLDGSGLPMSGEGTRIVERYELGADRLSMDRTMTVHDRYYTEPLVRRRASARGDEIDLFEQAPCDPDSHYRDLLTSGRLEEHFAR